LVRFRYILKAAADAGEFVRFRMLNPAWLTN
jgi:hypothetical protein